MYLHWNSLAICVVENFWKNKYFHGWKCLCPVSIMFSMLLSSLLKKLNWTVRLWVRESWWGRNPNLLPRIGIEREWSKRFGINYDKFSTKVNILWHSDSLTLRGGRSGVRGYALPLESVIPGFSCHSDRHFPYLNLGIVFYSKTIYLLPKIWPFSVKRWKQVWIRAPVECLSFRESRVIRFTTTE